MTAFEELARDGYRFVVPAPTVPEDFDRQQHLNNAAIVRVFNDLRIAYVVGAVGDWWPDFIAEHGCVVAARELHVLYESEGQPGESFVGAMRYTRRDGKALILEERLVEADTGRDRAVGSVARAGWHRGRLARALRRTSRGDRGPRVSHALARYRGAMGSSGVASPW